MFSAYFERQLAFICACSQRVSPCSHLVLLAKSACLSPTPDYLMPAGIKVDPDQGSVQPDRPPTQVFIPVVKTELNSHQHAQQQQPSILCDCGVPGAFCHAAGCTALYCRPCDRKKKAEDPCKGFVSCSLACCKRTKCCEQHRNMLRLCSQCDELCCKRATCPCCSNVFCNQCIGGHATPGCAA